VALTVVVQGFPQWREVSRHARLRVSHASKPPGRPAPCLAFEAAARLHDLRHSAASLLIASGVELAEVSMLLGHSELRVTMDFYAHLQKQTAAKAARHMDDVLNM
jgi:integrase